MMEKENNNLNLSQLRKEIQKEAKSQAAKGLIVGIIVLLSIALTGWWLYLKPKLVEVTGGLPKGAVVGFNSDSCPKVGWVENKYAYGMFLRGIDKSGKKIDPDGLRVPGQAQPDSYKEHYHNTYVVLNGWPKESGDRTKDGKPFYLIHSSKGGNKGNLPSKVSGYKHETRPKNVAVLYCEKT